jgi:hypothetical protein
MDINFKINIDTYTPDDEIEELLKDTKQKLNKQKLNDLKKQMEIVMKREITSIFLEEEIINCNVKVKIKKNKKESDASVKQNND